jgi:peroxiredoxin
MKNKPMFLLITVLSLMFSGAHVLQAVSTPAKGDTFPEITLSVPANMSEREYLGVTGEGSFRIAHIKADLVILEIFSMYCPYCQKEAPNVNELYNLIDKRPDLKDRIKIIGVGAGNTPFEVDTFRKRYDIRFPLFSDESFTVHEAVGEVRTPYFFVLKMTPDGSNKVVYSRVGSLQDPGRFLDMILKEAGIKQVGL